MQFAAYAISTPSPKLYLKVRGQTQTTRTPVHFIAVLDTSGSMDSEYRLTNCKDSLRFLTQFLTATDCLSIITFSSHATAAMKAIPMDRAGATQLESILTATHADGGTNMSAAINCIQECIEAAPALKTDILFLTDGHANEGIIGAPALHAMLRTKLRDYPTVSVSSVGYGVDHNVDLLRGIAEGHDGSYNVVCNRENVASVFGLLLGGLMSCVGSNVEITVPDGTVCLPSNLRITPAGAASVKVHVGDVYADTESQILLSLPSVLETLPITGYDVATSEDITVLVSILQADAGVQQEVAVFELRQEVSALLRRCSSGHGSADSSALLAEVVAMKARIAGADAVSAMLLRSLTEAEDVLRSNALNNQTRVLFAQNSAYTQMGRGLRATVSAAATVRASEAHGVEEDPDDSPFASPMQRHYRQISQALSIAAAPSNPTTPHHTFAAHSQPSILASRDGTLHRQVARHLTEEEVAAAEELAAYLTPARAPAPVLAPPPLLSSPPPISRIQYATNLFGEQQPSLIPPPFQPLTRQIAAPSRQTSNVSQESGSQRLGFISPDMSPLVGPVPSSVSMTQLSPIFNGSHAPTNIPVLHTFNLDTPSPA